MAAVAADGADAQLPRFEAFHRDVLDAVNHRVVLERDSLHAERPIERVELPQVRLPPRLRRVACIAQGRPLKPARRVRWLKVEPLEETTSFFVVTTSFVAI